MVAEAREIATLAYEIETLRKKYERAIAELGGIVASTRTEAQSEIRAEIAKIDRQFVADVKNALMASSSAILKAWERDMAKCLSDMKATTAKAEEVYSHIKSISKGEKGDKPIVGIDFPFPQDAREPDEGVIAELLLQALDTSLPIKQTARGLENLPEKDKMSKAAIAGLEAELRQLSSKIAQGEGLLRGGGTTGLSPSGLLSVSGTIDDSNVTFTCSTEPTLLVVNGNIIQPTGGSITFVYSAGVITLSSAVGSGGSLFGIL